MKGFLLLILLICTTLQAQASFIQTTGNQLDYFKSNIQELKDNGGNNLINPNDLDTLILNGDSISNNFGYSVSSAGDVNGDGYSDIVVGCNVNSAPNNAWRAYIYYGGSTMNNIADVTITGNLNTPILSVSTAGDVNGDGYSDVIVGSVHRESVYSWSYVLTVYIFFGGISMDTISDFSVGDGPLFDPGAPQYSVSTVGDVNGDGYSDIMIGSSSYNHELWYYPGHARIFYGGSFMDNIADVYFSDIGSGWNFSGIYVSSAGDVNGDGYSDVILGVPEYNIGKAFIFYGGISMDNIADIILTGSEYDFGKSVSTAGDVNGDGYSDVIVGAYKYNSSTGQAYIFYGGYAMNNIADVVLTGEVTNNYFGHSVSMAGDINGDGYSDVIVGAYGFGSNKGRSYIYYGGSSMNNIVDVTLTGETINNYFGNSVSNAGDVNGDGYSEIIVGAYGYYNNTGRAYVYISKPSLRIKLKVLMEGMYSSLYNQLARKDSVTLLLRDITFPFVIRDSSKFVIDSFTFSKQFAFFNAPPGNYYLVAKHFNCIETWSKAGGEYFVSDTTVYNYDFTSTSSQAYGKNLKLKGSKYCLYSGDVNQDGFISLSDVISIYNDASGFVTGRFIKTDLTGDNIVDLTDVTLCYNNSSNFVRVIRP